MCRKPAATAQAPAFSRPIPRKAAQTSRPTSALVTSIMNRYFWMESLMSSMICTLILRFDSVGPDSRTSLRLNVSPPTRRKKVRNSTMIA